MNLDDPSYIRQHDPSNMLAEINGLPEQFDKAWKLGQVFKIFSRASGRTEKGGQTTGITRVVIAGMGGSAIGADLLAAYIQPICRIPVSIHRDYGLPAFAAGQETLVVASSHSGNTEETLDAFEAAIRAGCQIVVICTGGELARRASAAKIPVWKFDHAGMPRAAVGYSFGLLLALFTRLGLIGEPADLTAEVTDAVSRMKKQQESLDADVPTAKNPAKRMGSQLAGKWINVMGAGVLAPVARRWKGQINELAKAGAGWDALPEADHNSLAGLLNPDETLAHTCTLFLQAGCDQPRNRKRLELTHAAYKNAGLQTDSYTAQGDSRLAQIWTTLHFGDYLAFYLGMAYGVDPTPILALEEFKLKMQAG